MDGYQRRNKGRKEGEGSTLLRADLDISRAAKFIVSPTTEYSVRASFPENDFSTKKSKQYEQFQYENIKTVRTNFSTKMSIQYEQFQYENIKTVRTNFSTKISKQYEQFQYENIKTVRTISVQKYQTVRTVSVRKYQNSKNDFSTKYQNKKNNQLQYETSIQYE